MFIDILVHCYLGILTYIDSGIPLSRGLAPQLAAVITGIILRNEVGQLNPFFKKRMFDYCRMIERHPDNIGAAPVWRSYWDVHKAIFSGRSRG